MELLHEVNTDGLESYDFDLTDAFVGRSPFIKLFGSGELAAGGRDRRCLISIIRPDGNVVTSGYTSFVVMDGHANHGEWDGRGFYVGRNGWSLDASMATEFMITKDNLTNKVIATGMSTFSNGNNSILGYTCNGFCLYEHAIAGLRMSFDGGTFSGNWHLYKY